MKGETGNFKCFEHDRQFEDPDAFYKHLSVLDHTHVGISPCKSCGKSVNYRYIGKVFGGIHKPTCEDCDKNG